MQIPFICTLNNFIDIIGNLAHRLYQINVFITIDFHVDTSLQSFFLAHPIYPLNSQCICFALIKKESRPLIPLPKFTIEGISHELGNLGHAGGGVLL